jgi:hypothetical protein
MVAEMKYVKFRGDDFVILPDHMAHSSCANVGIPVSAGSCSITQVRDQFDDIIYKVVCWGHSQSLKIKSAPEDSEALSIWLR